MSKACTICQTESPGAYCPACGAPVDGARCKACEAALLAGARFCIQCGEPVRRAASSNVPWYVAGASLLVVLAVVAIGAAGREDGSAAPMGTFSPAPAAAGPGGAMAGSAPPLTGTPREQADRLFNRIMQALSQNDTSQASFFLPMAVLAYRQAGELDTDGLIHLSLLETLAGDPANGRETAERVLATSPDHVLALGAAARAATRAGDTAAARAYYRHLLDAFDAEQARNLPEYRDHALLMSEYRDEAEAVASSLHSQG